MMSTQDFLNSLPSGKKARLQRMLYGAGPGNGTLYVLPIDQGLEHGPVDFIGAEEAENTAYHFSLALQGGYSAIALHYGLARRYFYEYAGKIPLIIKINGKTCIPSDEEAFSPCTASVEEAVRLGADAIGYTLFVGSPRQDEDIAQFVRVRQEADRFGLPVIMWAYPRGRDIDAKGGKDSLYAVEYAARVGEELGADIVKVNVPSAHTAHCPAPYDTLTLTEAERVARVVKAAGRAKVLFSGGAKMDTHQDILDKAKLSLDGGALGIIFGRNMWQRPLEDAVVLSQEVSTLLKKY